MRRLLAFLLSAAISTPLSAIVSDQLFFSHVSTQEGLSCSVVHSICKDDNGFVWVGTSYGLNRYDGFRFTSYFKDDINVNSNFISHLCTDKQGNVWVATEKGIAIYNNTMDRFFNLEEKTGLQARNKILAMQTEEDGTVNISIRGEGMIRVNPNDWSIKRTDLFLNGERVTQDIASIYPDSGMKLFLVGLENGGLYTLNRDDGSIQPLAGSGGINSVKSIISSGRGTYYVANAENLIYEVDPLLKKARRVGVSLDKMVSINAIKMISINDIAIATNFGLYIYDTVMGTTIHKTYSVSDKFSIPDNIIYCIYGTLDSEIFLGTHGSGMAVYHSIGNNFEKIYQTDKGENLAGSRISALVQASDDKVWVATELKGLYSLSLSKGTLSKYHSSSLPYNINCMAKIHSDLLLGSSQGFFKLNPDSGAIQFFQNSRGKEIHCIYPARDGRVLVGTSEGVMEYIPRSNTLTGPAYLEKTDAFHILEDRRGTLWVCSNTSGLYRIDVEEGRIDSYVNDQEDNSSIEGDKILLTMHDSRGNIWVAPHGYGLSRYTDEGFTHPYDIFNSTEHNVVYSIVEDDRGILWIASNKGLIAMNPDNGSTETYTEADGILNNIFNYGAGLKTLQGDILFGSRDGIIRFRPGSFNKHGDIHPTMMFTGLAIDGRIIHPGDRNSPLEKNICLTDKITLSPSQRNFTITVSMLNSGSSKMDEMYYRLAGRDADWQKVDASRQIRFENLKGGHYILHTKGKNSFGIWDENAPKLELYLRYSFFEAPSVKVGILIIVIILAIYLFRLLFSMAKSKEEKRLEEQEKQRKLDAFNEKMIFFTNIAHELKTPLTLIRTPLDNILHRQDLDASMVQDLGMIDRNARSLSSLLMELLDFSKVEREGYQLNCEHCDIRDIISLHFTNFSPSFSDRKIKFSLDMPEEKVEAMIDKDGFGKILDNLFGNALKYAETFTRITLSEKGGNARLEVENDGNPVPAEYRESIFDSFVQYKDKKNIYTTGVGIGLSFSKIIAELHHGTLSMDDNLDSNTFVLTIPLDEKEYAEVPQDELISADTDSSDEGLVVMVVEDNVELRKYIAGKIGEHYSVIEASDGQEALAKLENNLVSLVVSDLAMPHMDGLQLIQAIRGDFRFSHIITIILSAHTSSQDKIAGMDSRADMYIEKPFSLDYLLACIKTLTNNRKMLVKSLEHTEREDIGTESPYSGLSTRDAIFLQNLERLIDENLSDPEFSMEDLSGSLHLSKSTLNRKVRGLLNEAPNDHLRARRLLKAKELMDEGADRINEICYSVGFQTPSYFIKCFKKHFGMLPTEYLNRKK